MRQSQRLSKELLEMIPDFVDVIKLPKGFVFLNPAWDPSFDVDTNYRTEINKVIRRCKTLMYNFEVHEADVRQAINFELWQATKL